MPAIRTERYWMAGLEKPSRSRERRALILQTATDLFLEHGYAGTSTDAIVQRSSVSKQTVYAHFGSKEELFRAAIDCGSDRLDQESKTADAETLSATAQRERRRRRRRLCRVLVTAMQSRPSALWPGRIGAIAERPSARLTSPC
jgi:AcrR family transcriptional regulator